MANSVKIAAVFILASSLAGCGMSPDQQKAAMAECIRHGLNYRVQEHVTWNLLHYVVTNIDCYPREPNNG